MNINILKTFDNFYRESLSIIKEQVINIIFASTANVASDGCCIYTHLKNNSEMQMSVFNNENVYNLLNCAWEKYKKNLKNENN